MIQKTKSQKGFTLIELLLSITLISISLGVVLYYAVNSQVRSDLYTQTAGIVSDIRLVQSNAASGRTTQPHGIHLDTNSYTQFIGSTYNPASPTNYTTELPPSLSITDISLNAGGSDIVFDEPHGRTGDFGSFRLTSPSLNRYVTIYINAVGKVHDD